jgi:hypothetical protein
MPIVTGKYLQRRTFLRGLGTTVALPFLEAFIPAGRRARHVLRAQSLDDPTRLVCIENVHGAAGSTQYGASRHLWSPAAEGQNFDLGPTALNPLEPFRDTLTIISDTDVAPAEAITPPEIGGDHFRSSATFLTQAHPRQTESSDVRAGISLDQLYAQRFGQNTPIPSMQLCIENVDHAGGCAYGYSCVYTDTISWTSPTEPLPMIRDPRLAFDQLFGAGGTAEERDARRRERRSVLDFITAEVAQLKRELDAADQRRMDDYLEDVREIERRIQRVETRNLTGEARELPGAPAGVPDSFDEHVRLMFDLQALAFQTDMTRVFSFKLSRDATGRVYPNSGITRGFHPVSHHGGRERNIEEFARLNRYHVGLLPYFLEKLERLEEAEGTLLDKALVMYGSPMGDPNVHNHKRCPLFLVGGANGQLAGNLHLRAKPGTPMANVMLDVIHRLGLDDIQQFGDSTGTLSLSA